MGLVAPNIIIKYNKSNFKFLKGHRGTTDVYKTLIFTKELEWCLYSLVSVAFETNMKACSIS